jgi:hypothetical protein
VIQSLDIGLLPYLVSTGAFSESNAKFMLLAWTSGERPPSQTVGTVLVPRAGGESRRRFTGTRAR